MDNEQTRMDELDGILATTGGTMLGMTIGCARCHNHKFDPIPQKDYYRMQAVFFPADREDKPIVSRDDEAKYKESLKAFEAQLKPLDQPGSPTSKRLSARRSVSGKSPSFPTTSASLSRHARRQTHGRPAAHRAAS